MINLVCSLIFIYRRFRELASGPSSWRQFFNFWPTLLPLLTGSITYSSTPKNRKCDNNFFFSLRKKKHYHTRHNYNGVLKINLKYLDHIPENIFGSLIIEKRLYLSWWIIILDWYTNFIKKFKNTILGLVSKIL